MATAPCSHCGLPTAAGEETERYCCSGCFIAHRVSDRRGHEESGDPLLARLVLSAFLAMGVMVFSLSLYGSYLGPADGDSEAAGALRGVFRLGTLLLSAPVLALLLVPLAEATVQLRRWLSADALVVAGAGAAFLVSTWNTFAEGDEVYFETATAVLVLYTLGKWLDVRARERARKALTAIAPAQRAKAMRVETNGEAEVHVEALERGDLVRVRPGERIPVDGQVVEGASFVERSALTGEERPASVRAGDRVWAGSVLVDGSLVVRTEDGVGTRLCDDVERLLERARGERPRLALAADRFARVLLPAVMVVAVAAGLWHGSQGGIERGLLVALSVVLISCPCALGIATPLAFWVALGEAWRRGALIRGGAVLERLARARRVFLDKTGTLTTGELELTALRPRGDLDEHGLLRLAASLELGSEHPLGRSIVAAWRARTGSEPVPCESFRVVPGRGVRGVVDGHALRLERGEDDGPHTVLRLMREQASGHPLLGELLLDAEARPEARAALSELREAGLALRILTGDGANTANALADELGAGVDARLLPGDKVERIRAAGAAGSVFVGDGLNDAAALAATDVGISMPRGAQPSLEAASVNLLHADLRLVPALIRIARAAVRTAWFNLVWAFGYNAIGLWLAASGRLTPIFAASAMVASSLVVVLASGRLAKSTRENESQPAGAPTLDPVVAGHGVATHPA